MAETPAPTLIGAQHIVVACEFEGDVSPSDQRSLCEQLVRKAKRYTNLPVTLATSADLGPGVNLRQQSKQLLLRVKGRASVANDGRRSLALEVTPVRLARPLAPMAVRSTTSPLPMAPRSRMRSAVRATTR